MGVLNQTLTLAYYDLKEMNKVSADARPYGLSAVHGPLARYVKLRVRMRRECRERFPRHRE